MKDMERFVEAHFLGIELAEAPRVAKLLFREPNGTSFSLAAFDLHRLLVSEFRETNIVDRLILWDSSGDPNSYRDALDELVSGKVDPQGHNWKHVVEAETREIRDGVRVLVSIEAVFGAQVLMLARNIVVSE
ncbi:MAG: hypothetical protein AB7O72_12215 [Ramlibacter sp.]